MNAMLKKLNSKRNGKKGFTLMEMLIVVAIIAVMVAIAIPTFSGALDKANKATDDANIRAAYAQYQISEMLSDSNGGTVGTANIAAVKKALKDIGVTEMKVYDTITVTAGAPWKGSGDGKAAVDSITVTTPTT